MVKLVSQRTFAQRCSVTQAYISRLIKEGKLSTTNGKIDLEGGKREMEMLSNPAMGQDDDNKIPNAGGPITFAKAKVMREAYNAKITQLNYEEKTKALVPVNILGEILDSMSGQIAALLSAIPAKIKLTHPHLPASVLLIIEKEIVKTQNVCAEVKPKLSTRLGRNR